MHERGGQLLPGWLSVGRRRRLPRGKLLHGGGCTTSFVRVPTGYVLRGAVDKLYGRPVRRGVLLRRE